MSSESAPDFLHKIKSLLRAGTRAAVIVYPLEREVCIRRLSGSQDLQESDTLRIGNVLPGFVISASTLFKGI